MMPSETFVKALDNLAIYADAYSKVSNAPFPTPTKEKHEILLGIETLILGIVEVLKQHKGQVA